MTEGLSTSWVIDESVPVDSNSNNVPHVPVLMINITFYINLDTFKLFTDIIDIYEGNKHKSQVSLDRYIYIYIH
jgi:hypothetical protein